MDMTIGRVAEAAGVTVETIRFYQRVGLVEEPARPAGGFRRYPRETVSRLRFIKRAQTLGFSLEEIRNLLALERGQSCGKARELAARKLAMVQARIADLSRMRRTLRGLIGRCERSRGRIACPIISTLSGPEASDAIV